MDVREFDCLFCYNHADIKLVRPIFEFLEGLGLRCWIDSDQIDAGDDWTQRVTAAMKRSRSVLVCYGPSGPGKWQAEEWRFLGRECIERGIRFIPIEIAGGEIPHDLVLRGRVPLEFDPNSADAVVVLERLGASLARRGDELHEYEIMIGVDYAEPTCCIAAAATASRDLFNILENAATDAGLKVLQTIDATKSATFNVDVVSAVRATSILLADCTRDPGTGLPHPNVTFQMGLARSLGKPVIVVTDCPIKPVALFQTDFDQIVEYNRQAIVVGEPNSFGPLVETIASQLQKCLDRQAPPYGIDSRDGDVAIARADVITMRATFWNSFRTLQRFGLKVHHAFHEVAYTVHDLERLADVLQEDMTTIGLDVHHNRDFSQFRRAHEEFRKAHTERAVALLESHLTNGESLDAAYEGLKRRTHGKTLELVEKGHEYYKLLMRMLSGYRFASEPLLSDGAVADTLQIEAAIRCLTQVRTLASFVEQVQVQAHAMLLCLLELIGEEPRPGGYRHDRHRTGNIAPSVVAAPGEPRITQDSGTP